MAKLCEINLNKLRKQAVEIIMLNYCLYCVNINSVCVDVGGFFDSESHVDKNASNILLIFFSLSLYY